MQIGIDFGSTYSTVSKYNPVTDNVEAVTLVEGEPASIPSVVSISKKGKPSCGAAAKNQVGKSTVRIFEAFKMLLIAENQEMLQARGYDDTYTPRYITKCYLESILKGVLHHEGESKYENVVICAPEVWFKNLTTIDGRSILRSILTDELELDIGTVKLVSEPAAASAFYAYHYEKNEKKAFNGHLLLIDYGGGTLDITLTEVISDGHGRMEICYKESGGMGENHPDGRNGGVIGCAGIAYMQEVLTIAMREAGFLEGNEAPDYTSPSYLSAMRDLESQLKSPEHIRDIEDVFGQYGSYKKMKGILKETEPVPFAELEYDGEELPVSFQQLFRAYQQTIEGPLEQQIKEINPRVMEHIGTDPCLPAAGARDDFKIALVGGFGSFFLVRAQIAELYNFNPNSDVDLRTRNIATDKREQAISLGAALIAARKVKLKTTAHFSIGLCTRDKDGNVNGLYYSVLCHQDLEPGKPYFILRRGAERDSPENRITWGSLYGNITDFVIEWEGRPDHGAPMKLKKGMLDKLRQLPELGLWYCGFSFDENDVVSFHVVPKPLLGSGTIGKGIDIQLDRLSGMFDLTDVKEVTLRAV